jgi:hypothetical protein
VKKSGSPPKEKPEMKIASKVNSSEEDREEGEISTTDEES